MNLTFQEQQSGKEGNITLDGEITLNHAEELRMLLIKALIDADRVVVDFGPVSDVDISCLQLLCSAHRSAGRMKKVVSLSRNWPAPFAKAVRDAGYKRLTGCRLDMDHSCLWVRR